MKTQVNPVVAAIVIVAVLGVAALVFFKSSSQTNTDTGLPPEIVKKMKERGPKAPMPPMPMPGGGTLGAPAATQGGAVSK